MFEELDVFDLVLGRVDREQVLQVDDLGDVADVVLAEVQDLQVHVGTQVRAQLLDLFLLEVQLREGI